jgi:protein-disulfide isomerase
MDDTRENPDIPTTVRSLRSRLENVATIVFIATCLVFIWAMLSGARVHPSEPEVVNGRPEVPLPVEPISIEGDVTRGAATAKLVLIQYSDFECPSCARFARDTLPAIEAQYIKSGRVLMVFRHLPLSFHPRAQKAAEAAECADRQNRFWEMHDALFASPRDLQDAALINRARAVGLDTERFRDCISSGNVARDVLADVRTARGLRISGTPFFFIGVRQNGGHVLVRQGLSGAHPVAAFERAFRTVSSQ